MGKYTEWIKYGFAYGATLGVILGILSLFIGTLLIFVSPMFALLGAVGFVLFIMFAVLTGLISIVRFLIGRFLYNYIDPIRSDYWRAVAVALLGTLVLFIVSIPINLVIFIAEPGIPTLLAPFITVAFTAIVTLVWSLAVVGLWRALKWEVPD